MDAHERLRATTTHVTEVNGRRQLVFSYSLSLWRAR
jgi:hypothetical protein